MWHLNGTNQTRVKHERLKARSKTMIHLELDIRLFGFTFIAFSLYDYGMRITLLSIALQVQWYHDKCGKYVIYETPWTRAIYGSRGHLVLNREPGSNPPIWERESGSYEAYPSF